MSPCGSTGVVEVTGSGVLLAVVCALAGGVAGGGARLLLGRLRRGVVVRVGCCEVLLGGLWAVAGLAWASGSLSGRLLPLLLGLAWFGVAAGAVDVLRRRLPDALTVPAIPAGLLLLVPLGPAAVARGVAGAAVGLSAYGALHLVRPAALGAGDVKLAGSLGAVLAGVSWPAAALAAVLAGLLTVTLALITSQATVPHGPGMVTAAWAVLAAAAAGAPVGPVGAG
jgi:leader peptidase (prepilin peptidase) / N-methyltransferase